MTGSSSTTSTRFCCSAFILYPAAAQSAYAFRRCQTQLLLNAFFERNERIDVDRNVARGIERAAKTGRHFVVLVEPCLGAGAISCRFDFEQLLRQRGNRRGHLRVVDDVPSRRRARDRAVFGEIVELHHLCAAMRLGGSEADGSENAGYVR